MKNQVNTREAIEWLSRDPELEKIIGNHKPLQLEQSANLYHELIKNIAYQQISYKAADSIFQRFIKRIGTENYKPEELLAHDFESIRSCGFSKQKCTYIQCISEYFIEHELMNRNWGDYSDKEIMETLLPIKGVGSWTVKMILIFQLHRPDVFPHEDLAIRQVIKEIYNLNEEKKAFVKSMDKIAEGWKPYRTSASLYLWSYKRAQINSRT